MNSLTQVQSIITFAWWMAFSLSVVLYVVLDGADLGAGVFSLFVRKAEERGAIMSAMAGTWDANETWLIVAGGVMFAAFPFVYGSAFSYLMIPLALALWGMITRAVALEFRHVAEARWQRFSDLAFGLSSLVVAFFGGMALGAVMQGFPLTHDAGTVPTYVGGALRFISPFSIWTGIASVIAVTQGGVLFIRARFHHGEPIRRQAARWSSVIFYLALAVAIVTIVFSMAIFPWAAHKWLGPNFWIWAIVLLAVIISAVMMRTAANRDKDLKALIWFTVALAIMSIAFLATLYPWMVPGTWTIYSGASPAVSLFTFTLAMGGFFPIMIMYNAYQIWVFRGRISAMEVHH
ncbi:cytochrome d ubiquinol oxidase subunit II [Acidocella sp.]|jgi:cytochrome d ubiquinol oxidase subunit II|uniref:cytochrome d ubiquinol oxidase subunit II n=1 Tax=Acidocella sp. TaxID=50710 RepID=UPI002F40ABCD